MKIRQIEAHLHIHATESMTKVRDALRILFPFDLTPDELEITNMTGSFGNPIYGLNISLRTNSLITQFIDKLGTSVSIEDKHQMTKEFENRVDEKLNWFFRISKQHLVLGQIRLAINTKDVIQIIISIQNRNPRSKVDIMAVQGFLENLQLLAPKENKQDGGNVSVN